MIENFDDKIDEIECIKIQLRVLEYNYNMYKQKAEAAEARLRAIRKINDGNNSAIDALCESEFKQKKMTFRFLQTSKPYLCEKKDMTMYPTATEIVDEMIAQHPSLKRDEDGLPIIEISTLEELTKFIDEECKDSEIVVGHDAAIDGWYIEDYDDYRE